MESSSRRVRKDAFECLYAAYEAQRNTLATTYNYNTKTDVITARIRRYNSSLEAALSGDDIPIRVYDNLIETVNRYLPLLHRYVGLRKKALGLDEVHMYDMYAPLVENPVGEIEYEKALEMIAEGLTPWVRVYLHHEARLFPRMDRFMRNQGKTEWRIFFREVTTAIRIYC